MSIADELCNSYDTKCRIIPIYVRYMIRSFKIDCIDIKLQACTIKDNYYTEKLLFMS